VSASSLPERAAPGERLKVLFVAHSYPRFPVDPVGSFILRLAVALRSCAVDVLVIAPAGPDLAATDTYEGIPVQRFRYAPVERQTLAYTGTMAAQARSSWSGRLSLAGLLTAGVLATRRAARRWAAAVVHAHWWFPGAMIALGARPGLGFPVVTTLHGSDLRVAREGRFARRLFRSIARRSSALTAVSGWLANEARQLAPEVTPLVEPMPIAPDLFYPGDHRERDRLLFVGKLTPQKGFPQLLEALGRMRRQPLVDIVVGTGSDIVEGQALAAAAGVAERLRWYPLLEQAALAELYRRATVLVMPSVDEGLGLVAVEALMCETPVVGFDSGGIGDSVLHQRTGLLVPPGDSLALASAMDDLLSRPDQGAALGRAGRQYVLPRFAPDAVACRYADLYRRVSGPPEP
jgi:glycosyltransferase involved in cell wall biosynthesis